jgi:ArsR family transcriptional regulator, arsenate/arsenite/antimonite-responsive transcriptional repressor
VAQSEIECRSSVRPPLPPDEAARTANVFRALANPHRVQLMGMLSRVGVPVCVCDLQQALGLAQSTTSHHLKQLVGAGLLRREQRGLWAYYSVDPDAVELLRDLIEPAVRTPAHVR